MFVLYAQRNVKRPDRCATRIHHPFIVCIIRATERQNTGLLRNKTPPLRYCLHHTRNRTSKDRIVTQQYATIASQDPTRSLKWPQDWTVPILTRYPESTKSDGYRTVIRRLKSSQIPQTYKIGRLSDGYRTVKFITRSDRYQRVKVIARIDGFQTVKVIARSDRYRTLKVISGSDRYRTVKILESSQDRTVIGRLRSQSLHDPSHRTIRRTNKILQWPQSSHDPSHHTVGHSDPEA